MHRTILVIGITILTTILTLVPVLPASAEFRVPGNDGYVTDNADVLSESTEQSLEAMATELNQKTKSQLAILTVPTLDGTPLETASLEVARQWGVGDKKTSNGLLIFLAMKEHKLRTEIGYGLEGIITDGTSGAIQDRFIIPYFRQGNFETGLLAGSKAYAGIIAKENGVTLTGVNQNIDIHPRQQKEDNSIPWPVIIFVVLFILPMFFGRRRGSGFYMSPFIGGGFGGGGYSGGGSSFGGFGGGSFGGGGSSRDW